MARTLVVGNAQLRISRPCSWTAPRAISSNTADARVKWRLRADTCEIYRGNQPGVTGAAQPLLAGVAKTVCAKGKCAALAPQWQRLRSRSHRSYVRISEHTATKGMDPMVNPIDSLRSCQPQSKDAWAPDQWRHELHVGARGPELRLALRDRPSVMMPTLLTPTRSLNPQRTLIVPALSLSFILSHPLHRCCPYHSSRRPSSEVQLTSLLENAHLLSSPSADPRPVCSSIILTWLNDS